MDTNQSRIIELLREVHLIAFKEMERLNLRIIELENLRRRDFQSAGDAPKVHNPPLVNPPSFPRQPEILSERQVAEYLNMSAASLRKWRRLGDGPKFVKIGRAVRYKRQDVDTWLSSCPGLR